MTQWRKTQDHDFSGRAASLCTCIVLSCVAAMSCADETGLSRVTSSLSITPERIGVGVLQTDQPEQRYIEIENRGLVTADLAEAAVIRSAGPVDVVVVSLPPRIEPASAGTLTLLMTANTETYQSFDLLLEVSTTTGEKVRVELGGHAAPRVDCDDGNPCTEDRVDGRDCVHVELSNGTACGEDDACLLNAKCGDGLCVGAPLDCNDDSECTVDSCDAELGCVNETDLSACDDGDPCTEDSCDMSGSCTHSLKPVGAICSSDGCRETGFCNSAGSCEVQETPDGFPCDDGNSCSSNDLCSAGACVAETQGELELTSPVGIVGGLVQTDLCQRNLTTEGENNCNGQALLAPDEVLAAGAFGSFGSRIIWRTEYQDAAGKPCAEPEPLDVNKDNWCACGVFVTDTDGQGTTETYQVAAVRDVIGASLTEGVGFEDRFSLVYTEQVTTGEPDSSSPRFTWLRLHTVVFDTAVGRRPIVGATHTIRAGSSTDPSALARESISNLSVISRGNEIVSALLWDRGIGFPTASLPEDERGYLVTRNQIVLNAQPENVLEELGGLLVPHLNAEMSTLRFLLDEDGEGADSSGSRIGRGEIELTYEGTETTEIEMSVLSPITHRIYGEEHPDVWRPLYGIADGSAQSVLPLSFPEHLENALPLSWRASGGGLGVLVEVVFPENNPAPGGNATGLSSNIRLVDYLGEPLDVASVSIPDDPLTVDASIIQSEGERFLMARGERLHLFKLSHLSAVETKLGQAGAPQSISWNHRTPMRWGAGRVAGIAMMNAEDCNLDLNAETDQTCVPSSGQRIVLQRLQCAVPDVTD